MKKPRNFKKFVESCNNGEVICWYLDPCNDTLVHDKVLTVVDINKEPVFIFNGYDAQEYVAIGMYSVFEDMPYVELCKMCGYPPTHKKKDLLDINRK